MNTATHRGSNKAFSLVEIALALGIISFVLVSLLGLLGVGLSASRESMSETTLSGIAAQIFGSIDAQTFAGGAASPIESYFTLEGWPTSQANAYYVGVLSSREAGADEIAGVSTRLRLLSLELTWPSGKEVVHATQLAE